VVQNQKANSNTSAIRKKNPHDIYVKLDNYIFGVGTVDLRIYQKHE